MVVRWRFKWWMEEKCRCEERNWNESLVLYLWFGYVIDSISG